MAVRWSSTTSWPLLGQGVVFAYPATPWDSGTHERERAAAPVPPQQAGLRRCGRNGEGLAVVDPAGVTNPRCVAHPARYSILNRSVAGMSSGMTDRVRPGRRVSSVLCGVLSVLVERPGIWSVSLVMRRSGVRLPKVARSTGQKHDQRSALGPGSRCGTNASRWCSSAGDPRGTGGRSRRTSDAAAGRRPGDSLRSRVRARSPSLWPAARPGAVSVGRLRRHRPPSTTRSARPVAQARGGVRA